MRRPAQALVEFALASLVFMVLVMGTFDLGRAYLGYLVMTNAARDASRYGAAHAGEACWEAKAAPNGSNLGVVAGPQAFKDSLPVCATAPPGCPQAPVTLAQHITVCGTYSFIPLVGPLLGHTIDIAIQTSAPVG
jgi:Flp pilus assembly protein TadG